MMQDIASREDLFTIVKSFYDDLMVNEELGHFFVDFKEADVLMPHLHTLVNFWDNTLFYSGTYKKNAIKPHIQIHDKHKIDYHHFDQWLLLFNRAVDSHFKGQNAETIKSRALSIATVMKLKLNIV